MYKVMKIHRWAATRDVELLNEITKTNDLCFDDSAVAGIDNFEFMVEGKSYDCKIQLFGHFLKERTASSVEIKIINSEIVIGETAMFEVRLDKDVYYIPQEGFDIIDAKSKLFFDFTRKDLIQVNNIIHPDLL